MITLMVTLFFVLLIYSIVMTNSAVLVKETVPEDIPGIVDILPKPEWRVYADEVITCVGVPPKIPYDNITWKSVPAYTGIPKDLFPGLVGPNRLIMALTFIKPHVIVLGPWVRDDPGIIKDELTHALYNSGGLFHDPNFFSKKCYNLTQGAAENDRR
jgi:hypothetical protein